MFKDTLRSKAYEGNQKVTEHKSALDISRRFGVEKDASSLVPSHDMQIWAYNGYIQVAGKEYDRSQRSSSQQHDSLASQGSPSPGYVRQRQALG